jgi:hypothetical protein
MKTYVGVNVEIRVFLTSALAETEWPASRPGLFKPPGKEHIPIG